MDDDYYKRDLQISWHLKNNRLSIKKNLKFVENLGEFFKKMRTLLNV